MGINSVLLQLLANLKKKASYGGRLATLGSQEIMISENEFQQVFNLNGGIDKDYKSKIFDYLGFSCLDSIDISDKDGATILLDLNQPLPHGFDQKFDWIIDGGTMEHCFNVPMVMENIHGLLKTGGNIVHINPVQGYTNHGFYNLQPTFYFSFYKANNYQNLTCHLVEYLNQSKTKARIIELKENFNNLQFFTPNNTLIVFSAAKSFENERVKYPIQEFYYQIFKEKEKVNGAMLEDSLYRQIVGTIDENSREEILKNSYIIDFSH